MNNQEIGDALLKSLGATQTQPKSESKDSALGNALVRMAMGNLGTSVAQQETQEVTARALAEQQEAERVAVEQRAARAERAEERARERRLQELIKTTKRKIDTSFDELLAKHGLR